jgi:hypothetical protein
VDFTAEGGAALLRTSLPADTILQPCLGLARQFFSQDAG